MEFSGPIIADQAHLEAARRRMAAARTPVGRFLGRVSAGYYGALVNEDLEALEEAADLANLPPQRTVTEA